MSLSLARDTYKGVDMKWMSVDSGLSPDEKRLARDRRDAVDELKPMSRVRSSSPSKPILDTAASWCMTRAIRLVRTQRMSADQAALQAIEDYEVEIGRPLR